MDGEINVEITTQSLPISQIKPARTAAGPVSPIAAGEGGGTTVGSGVDEGTSISCSLMYSLSLHDQSNGFHYTLSQEKLERDLSLPRYANRSSFLSPRTDILPLQGKNTFLE